MLLENFTSNRHWSIDGDKMMFSEGFLKLITGEEMASEPGEAKIEEVTANRIVLSLIIKLLLRNMATRLR